MKGLRILRTERIWQTTAERDELISCVFSSTVTLLCISSEVKACADAAREGGCLLTGIVF